MLESSKNFLLKKLYCEKNPSRFMAIYSLLGDLTKGKRIK